MTSNTGTIRHRFADEAEFTAYQSRVQKERHRRARLQAAALAAAEAELARLQAAEAGDDQEDAP